MKEYVFEFAGDKSRVIAKIMRNIKTYKNDQILTGHFSVKKVDDEIIIRREWLMRKNLLLFKGRFEESGGKTVLQGGFLFDKSSKYRIAALFLIVFVLLAVTTKDICSIIFGSLWMCICAAVVGGVIMLTGIPSDKMIIEYLNQISKEMQEDAYNENNKTEC